MPSLSSRVKSKEMLLGVIFICILVTIACSAIAINNFDFYTIYQRTKQDANRFSFDVECHIDKIVSREIHNRSHHPPWTHLESKFLISIIHPSNNTTRQKFEETSVPIARYNSIINNSYLCYVDPRDAQRQPLTSLPDVLGARHEFIWRSCIPALVALSGLVILIVLTIFTVIDKRQVMIELRPRGFFRVRTHPTSTT